MFVGEINEVFSDVEVVLCLIFMYVRYVFMLIYLSEMFIHFNVSQTFYLHSIKDVF